ncbi:MAG: hypothetical protein Rubg2KO_23550 [Rubricoccaceae bacterium]
MRLVCLLGLMACFASPARAQDVPGGGCVTGQAQRLLSNFELQASLFNTGGLFFGGSTTFGDGYLIPKDPGISPIFAAGVWMAGTVGGDPRVAAARYGGWDFWPGPLEDAANPPQDCSTHDRIYVVSREDIREYYHTGIATDDLRDWPHQLGAPVLDGDGDSTNYDLRAGDQPDLIGDMAAWWVMNDAANDHNPSAPIGVEVRVLAFVYGPDVAQRPMSPVLTQTTFVRYEIVNRNDQPIEEMYTAMFADPDLGGAGDDYIGTDTLRNMGFVYNDSNEDSSYGIAPPAVGMQILIGPVVGEDTLGMTSTSTFIGGGPNGTQDPGTPEEYYNYMRGFWGNGLPIYEFGTGFEQQGAPTTRFFFAGDPVTESHWSEVNIDGAGTNSPQGDRRLVVSTGPYRIEPGEAQTILFAFPYGRGTSNLQSVAVLQGVAGTLQSIAAEGFFTGQAVDDPPRPRPRFELAVSRVRPNPSSGAAEVILTLPAEARVRATVVDVLGRQLEVLVDSELAEGETVLTLPNGLAPGTYVLRVEVTPGVEETIPFTVVR